MANTIPTELQQDVLLKSALRAFKKRILPLAQLSTVYRDVPLQGTNIVQVPYYPLVTAPSTNFNGTYAFGDTTTETRPVTVDRRKYQSLSITSAEAARQPNIDWAKHGAMKGEKLAVDVITDILSLVTLANFGAASFTGVASGFDSDDVADLRGIANGLDWPKTGRAIFLDSTYDTNLVKDDAIKAALNFGGNVAQTGEIGQIFGFGYVENPHIPENAENLIGFITYMSAILTAFSPIRPLPNVLSQLTRYDVVTDPDSGISLEYREWGEAGVDSDRRVIECNYGFAKGEAAALKRLVRS